MAMTGGWCFLAGIWPMALLKTHFWICGVTFGWPFKVLWVLLAYWKKMMGIRMLVVSENDDHFQVWWWKVCHLNWLTGDFCVPYFSTNALFGSFRTPGVTGVQASESQDALTPQLWTGEPALKSYQNRWRNQSQYIPIHWRHVFWCSSCFAMFRHDSWGNMLIPGPEEPIPSPSNRQRSLSFQPPAPAQEASRAGDRSWSMKPQRLGPGEHEIDHSN